VEYPDHVVDALVQCLDKNGKTLDEISATTWYHQFLRDHLGDFYRGWKAREQHSPVEKIRGPSMSDELYIELKAWLKNMKEYGRHPTVEELDNMVAMAGIVRRTIKQISDILDFEGS